MHLSVAGDRLLVRGLSGTLAVYKFMIRHILNRLRRISIFKSDHGIYLGSSELAKRIHTLEDRVRDLELSAAGDQKEPCPPIVVECLHIDKIMVDRAEMNNNFGSLGIKDLSGMLNIGANYGVGPRPETGKKPWKPTPSGGKNDNKQNQGQSLRCNINYGSKGRAEKK